MKEEKLYVSCECGSELMVLEHCKCTEVNIDDFTIAIYRYGYSEKPNLWQRLKYCFYHLKTGKKYTDQIIINPENAKKITDWINNELIK